MTADESVKAAFDCLNRILGFDENPNLNHVSSFGVF
jgi:bacterioferritin (cytochrome b1)